MSTSGITAAATPRTGLFREDVNAELVRYLYRQAPASIVTLFVVAAILAYILWDVVPRQTLLAWLVVLVAVNIVRFAQIGTFLRRAPPNKATPRWALFSAAGSALVGTVWAGACFLFLDPAHPISLIAITVILMGLSAGSVVNLASYLPSFWVVVGPSMGALVGVLLWHGDNVSNTVAVLATVASIAYVVAARNVHRLLAGSLQLSFENLALRREAEEKTALLEATLQNMRQGISLSDGEGRLRMWNPQFADLLGVPRARAGEGVSMREVLGGARPPLELGEAQRLEYRRDDGASVEVAQNAMPNGGRVVTYTDITDLKRREAALEAARRTAEQANAAKTRFLAAASHDLRQPIHALGLLFATLADRVRDASTAPLLELIDGAVDAVDSMLNSLLDISKLDAGVMRPVVGPVEPRYAPDAGGERAFADRRVERESPTCPPGERSRRVRSGDAAADPRQPRVQRIALHPRWERPRRRPPAPRLHADRGVRHRPGDPGGGARRHLSRVPPAGEPGARPAEGPGPGPRYRQAAG